MRLRWATIVFMGVGLLTACAQLQLTPTPRPTSVATPTLTPTPIVIQTPSPAASPPLAPTPTGSPAIEPTIRAQPTATSTPTATLEPPSGTRSEAPAAQQPIVGSWEGAELWPGGEAELIVEFFIEGETLYAVRTHGHEGAALENVSFEPPTVHFEIWADGKVIVTYDGELDGGAITGEVTEEGASATFVLERAEAHGEVVTAERDLTEAEQLIVGHWEGELLGSQETLEFIVDFVPDRGGLLGFITVPRQGTRDVASEPGSRIVQDVDVDLPRVRFVDTGSAGHGEGFERIYEGELVGDTISGQSSESEIAVPFTLKRTEARADAVTLGPGSNVVTLEHDGLVRRLEVRLPDSFQPGVAYPVVFWFHGASAAGSSSLLSRLANNEGFIAVMPDAYGPRWNNCFDTIERCQRFRQRQRDAGIIFSTADDVRFAEAVLDWLAVQVTVDEAKVYAIGWSSGAAMVQGLALRSDRFAAIAPIGGGGFFQEQPIPELAPISVFQIWGERDGGYGEVAELGMVGLSALDTSSIWARHIGCNVTPEVDASHPDITIYRHADCEDSQQLWLYAVREGGHWPALEGPGSELRDPPGDLFELAWSFFERKYRAPPPSVEDSPIPAAAPPSVTPSEPSEAPQPIVGYWEGAELWPGGEAELIVEFFMEGDTLQALRIHGHEGSALMNVSFEPPRVHFEIWENAVVIVTYDGQLEGGTITGEVAEEGESAPFVLERVED